MKLGILGLAMFSLSLSASGRSSSGKANPASQYLLYVGTYTKGESKGIYAFRYDPKSADATSLGLAAETANPSFLAASPDQRFLYAVNELTEYQGASSGAVTAFAINPGDGKLTQLNESASRGADPCYISFDRTGKYVLVANYTGGSIVVFPVSQDGHLEPASAFVQHQGRGQNPERQEGPHAHWIETTPDNRLALVADLGLDEILIYRFDAKTGTLMPNDPPFGKTDAVAGPRHVSLHPNGKFVYVIDELSSTITVFAFDSSHGSLQALQAISTLPADFKGKNDTAEIHVHPNGKFLFASNRGHDSIAVFSIDQNTGKLSFTADFPTGGKTPRNFELDPGGTHLLVANQDSGNIVTFTIDQQNGRLTSTGQERKVPSPVSLRFVKVQR